MFPQTGEWAGGEAAFPAAIKALDQINQREDILPGYYLNLSAYDTKVNQICSLEKKTNNNKNFVRLVFTRFRHDDPL